MKYLGSHHAHTESRRRSIRLKGFFMNAQALKLATLVALTASNLLACAENESGTPSGSGGQGATENTSAKGGATQANTTGTGGGKVVTNTTPNKAACVTENAATPATTSAVDSCKAFCVAEDHCDTTTTPEQCEEYRSCPELATRDASCQAASKIYWDCMRAQNDANICVDDITFCCGTQANAAGAACAVD